MAQQTRKRTLAQRVIDKQWTRYVGLPRETHSYSTTRDIPIPMRDGVELLGDLLEPTGPAKGTILVTSPYGWNVVGAAMTGGVFACRGYRVVLVRCRGTFGSGGEFEPFMNEVDDGHDIVAWMRQQPWWDGRFAMYGYSYCGFTEWAMLLDPPAELTTAVVACAPFSLRAFVYQGGAFLLSTMFEWSFVTSKQEKPFLKRIVAVLSAKKAVARALAETPLLAAAEPLLDGKAPWYSDWVTRRDPSDPWWQRADMTDALDKVDIPVLIQAGWQDGFLWQTLGAYARLEARGAKPALTVGPWTHAQGGAEGARILLPDALAWFDEHLADSTEHSRQAPLKIFVGGGNEGWRDSPRWPTATTQRTLHAAADGLLTDQPAAAGGSRDFTYDPADPTPSVGGAFVTQLSPGFTAGYVDDGALAARGDVVAFTSEPLVDELELSGAAIAHIAHRTDNPFADLFVRISDVDPDGRSRNVCDGFVRLDPAAEPDRTIDIELEPAAHRFAKGRRIRLSISGGSHPRWERNLGTGDEPATSSRMSVSHRVIELSGTRLELPVV